MRLKTLLAGTTRAFGFQVRRYHPGFHTGVVSLIPEATPRGAVLISYVLEPFVRGKNEAISLAHTHHTESVLMADVWRDLGFAVDVIDYRNNEFRPTKRYDYLVSARTHLAALAERLNPDCVKIAHLDTAHFLFNNAAAYRRALALQQRRGITSTSLRIVENNLAIECCDYAAVLGGDFCMDTYRYAGKPLFRLPVPMPRQYPFDADKDFDACRKHFLWFGSSGFVHKGLDLTLEAFAQRPSFHLSVCGELERDHEFSQLFHRELYETPNVDPIGWVDVAGGRFLDLANRSLAVVFPSCSESESCSVLTCMQAGLIPVVTRETGIDVGDFGVMLKDASVAAVQEAVEDLAGRPASQLKEMARKGWEYTSTHHSAERYVQEYRAMILQILNQRGVAT